jgi:hypothetical protein
MAGYEGSLSGPAAATIDCASYGPPRRLHPPAVAAGVPPRAEHLGVVDDPVGDAAILGGALEVGEDLALGREEAAPVRVERERVRVQVRGHVARAVRVRVGPPGAAERRGALEDHVVVDARLAQADGGADAAEAGADDRDADLADRRLGALGDRLGDRRHGVNAAARP